MPQPVALQVLCSHCCIHRCDVFPAFLVQGVERERSVLVDGSAIGTDPLFQAAGILTRPPPGEHLVRKRQREQQDQVRPTLC